MNINYNFQIICADRYKNLDELSFDPSPFKATYAHAKTSDMTFYQGH